MDSHRIKESLHGFPGQKDSNDSQCYGTGKTTQGTHFSCSKGKPGIVGMLAGKTVGKRRDAQRGGMGTHVPAIGGERHRAGIISSKQFHDHGYQGQAYHPLGASFSCLRHVQPKGMRVLPKITVVMGHVCSKPCCSQKKSATPIQSNRRLPYHCMENKKLNNPLGADARHGNSVVTNPQESTTSLTRRRVST